MQGIKTIFYHDNPPLSNKVFEIIQPIYENLSADELLERCLGTETRNNMWFDLSSAKTVLEIIIIIINKY